MPLIEENIEELLVKSEQNYLQFLKYFLQMQISCLQNMIYVPTDTSEQSCAEKQLIQSLTLIDHLLMHLYSRNYVFYDELNPDLSGELEGDLEEIEYLILEFEQTLSKYPFTNHSDLDQCERLIDQISIFFYPDHVKVIIVDDQLAEPWISF